MSNMELSERKLHWVSILKIAIACSFLPALYHTSGTHHLYQAQPQNALGMCIISRPLPSSVLSQRDPFFFHISGIFRDHDLLHPYVLDSCNSLLLPFSSVLFWTIPASCRILDNCQAYPGVCYNA